MLPERRQANAFEKYAPEDHKIELRRRDVGQYLQPPRHAPDRENESRQDDRRNNRYNGGNLERDLLAVGNRRDQEPDAEGGCDEEQGGAEKIQDAPLDQDIKKEICSDKNQRCSNKRNQRVRNQLAEDEVQGVHGRDIDLLDGVSFLLSYNGECGRNDRRDGKNKCDQSGNKEF